jgi:uncharacterized membrane protein
MSDLVVFAFNDEYTADRAKQRLLQLQNQHLILMDDLVVVVRHANGRAEVKQEKTTTGAAISGAFWGMLIGLLFLSPLLGAAIGAGFGAVMGHFQDLGVDEKFMREVGDDLKPGTSGIFLLIHQVTPDRVVSQLQEFNPKVIRTNLTAEREARLRAAFSEPIPAASTQTSIDEQLKSLRNLQERGLITEEDYNEKKKQLLGNVELQSSSPS